MRFLMIGAGGIGAYYAARLLLAGHELVLVARGAHLQAMQAQGLRVTHPDLQFDAPVIAVSQEDLCLNYQASDFDLIIFTTKAAATAPLCAALHDWWQAAETPVLSLQNGVDNELEIERSVGQARTLGGLAVRIGGHIVAPGCIEAKGVAEVVVGAWPNAAQNPALESRLSAFAEAFNQAGIPTRLSPKIQTELWRKLIINNGVNPLSAVTRLDTRSLTGHPAFTKVVYQLMQETASAARADGIELSQADVDEMYQLICQFDAIKTSMLVDREKGRPLELDEISGAVLQRSERLGIAAPYTEFVYSLVQNIIAQE